MYSLYSYRYRRVATAAAANNGQKRKNRALSRPSDLWHAARPNGFDSETQRWLSTLTTCWGVCLAAICPPGRSEALWQRATSPASMARSERRTRHGPRSWAGVIHASRRALAVAWPTLYVISKPSTVTSTMGSTKYLPPTVGIDAVSRYLPGGSPRRDLWRRRTATGRFSHWPVRSHDRRSQNR